MGFTAIVDRPRSIDLESLYIVARPRKTSDSKLLVLAEVASRLADRIEARWPELSEDEKQYWRAFAHMILEPTLGVKGYLYALRGRIMLALVALKGETDALSAFLNAMQRLTGAMLRAIELENPSYRETLAAAVREALDEAEAREAMTPERFREWLSSISSETLRKV